MYVCMFHMTCVSPVSQICNTLSRDKLHVTNTCHNLVDKTEFFQGVILIVVLVFVFPKFTSTCIVKGMPFARVFKSYLAREFCKSFFLFPPEGERETKFPCEARVNKVKDWE